MTNKRVFYKEIEHCDECPCCVMKQKWDEYWFCDDLEIYLIGLDEEYNIHPDCELISKNYFIKNVGDIL